MYHKTDRKDREMKLTINETGVYLDDHKVEKCTRVDIKNIDPVDGMEVVLHVSINEADVKWSVKE